MVTGFLTLTASLLMASASGTTEWLDEKRVQVSTTLDAADTNKLFRDGGKQLREMAEEACKDLGGAKIEGEAVVTGIAMSPAGKPMATLKAIYVCG